MPPFPPLGWTTRRFRRLVIAFVSLSIVALLVTSHTSRSLHLQAQQYERPLHEPAEIRGVWVTNVASSVLFSPWGIPRAVKQLAQMNFNTVYPVVWNRGKPFFRSKTFKTITDISIDPLLGFMHLGKDPLQEMVQAGHARSLRVMPWFEYGFMVPLNSQLARQHPDWLTKKANGALRLDSGVLTGEVRQSAPKGIAQLLNSGAPRALGWLNPLHPSVQGMLLDLIEEVVSNYDIDGIQLDDHFSLPAAFGYDDYTIALYRAEHMGYAPPSDPDDPDWIRWRAGKLSKFMNILHARVKAIDPRCVVSVSPNPAKFAYRFYLQDWPSWVEAGWVDELVVQVYRDELSDFERELEKPVLRRSLDLIPVSVGILTGTWRRPIGFDQVRSQVISSRDRHFSGVSFFYWETLWSYFTPESPRQRRESFRRLLSNKVY